MNTKRFSTSSLRTEIVDLPRDGAPVERELRVMTGLRVGAFTSTGEGGYDASDAITPIGTCGDGARMM